MNVKWLWIAIVAVGTNLCQGENAAADQSLAVDVTHYWISRSEAKALGVLKDAWRAEGNQWADIPAKNKVEMQRIVSERIANGYAPAIMQWHANEGSRELPAMGVVLDIDQIAREDHWAEILPATVLDRISYKGKVYFAPTNIHADNWLWTSKSAFNEVGLPTPRTWDEIFAAVEKIEKTGRPPIALGGGAWEVSLIFNNILFYKFGPEGYSRIISGDPSTVEDTRFVEALEMLRRVSRYVEPAEARTNKTWADATAALGRGDAGMQFMGDWAKGELGTLGFTVDNDFDCSLVPGTALEYFMVIDAFAFPQTNREETLLAQQAFARMVLDRDNQVAFSRSKGSLPARTDVDPNGFDRCGQFGLKMLAQTKSTVIAQSLALPLQTSEGWIDAVANFFNDASISTEATQRNLHDILVRH